MKPALERLIETLSGIAMYNDKGWTWSGHGPERIEQTQRAAQSTIDALLDEIGEAMFPTDLLRALRDGSASRDEFGEYVQRCKALLR